MKLKYSEIMELEMMIQGLLLFSQWKNPPFIGESITTVNGVYNGL